MFIKLIRSQALIKAVSLLLICPAVTCKAQQANIVAPNSLYLASTGTYSADSTWGTGMVFTYTVFDGEGTAAAPGTLGPPAPITCKFYNVHETITGATVVQTANSGQHTPVQPRPDINNVKFYTTDVNGQFQDHIGLSDPPNTLGTNFEKAQNVTLKPLDIITFTLSFPTHTYALYDVAHPAPTGHQYVMPGIPPLTLIISIIKTQQGDWEVNSVQSR